MRLSSSHLCTTQLQHVASNIFGVQIPDSCRTDQSTCGTDFISVRVPTTLAGRDQSVELDFGGFSGSNRQFRLMLLATLTLQDITLANFNSFSPGPQLNGMLLAHGANLTLEDTMIEQVCPVVAYLCAQEVATRVRPLAAHCPDFAFGLGMLPSPGCACSSPRCRMQCTARVHTLPRVCV